MTHQFSNMPAFDGSAFLAASLGYLDAHLGLAVAIAAVAGVSACLWAADWLAETQARRLDAEAERDAIARARLELVTRMSERKRKGAA